MRGLIHILRRFWADESGTTLVELAFVIPLFLLLFFGLIDFGRMGAEFVMADKAMQIASRIAVVRPAACPGVPASTARGATPVGT
ncbi:MAG: TadE/TadG family type IV pilus assembly protein, partial [Albidovulum sp.]